MGKFGDKKDSFWNGGSRPQHFVRQQIPVWGSELQRPAQSEREGNVKDPIPEVNRESIETKMSVLNLPSNISVMTTQVVE